eukprot:m.84906 g.84906  ORF g.84906 m.84906 type:complete len:412 (+) comp9611_c0_seq3:67-1302(+)
MDPLEIDVLVGQYLKERGYDVALLGLIDAAEVTSDAVAALPGGRLREILDDHFERTHAPDQANPVAPELQVPELEHAGDGHYARDLWIDLEKARKANCLSVRIHPDGSRILSGAADKTVVSTPIPDDPDDAAASVAASSVVYTCAGPVLSMDVNPVNTDLVLTGDMSGNSVVFSLASKKAVFTPIKHGKYVIRVAWSACGNYFVTASYDKQARLYKASSKEEDGGEKEPYTLVKTIKGIGQVMCAAFTPAAIPPADAELAVGVRDDNRIHLVKLSTLKTRAINMNANGDNWVSFTAMDVSFSPSGQFILVSTDKERLILYSRKSGLQVRNFYGAMNDEYSNPRHCWHPSGQYIYATSQLHDVLVWELHSSKVVAKMTDHTQPIKDIYYHPGNKMLVSTSFDRSIKLWREIL